MKRVVVAADRDALAAAAARHVAERARASITERGRFTIVLAGGSSPRATYLALARQRADAPIDWSRVHVFFGDERCVPPDDEQSNYGMAREALLAHVPIPAGQVHRMQGERGDLDRAARDYGDLLRAKLPLDELGMPVFDLVLLGIGEDGHTASIFPGREALASGPDLAVRVEHPDPRSATPWRLTLTLPVLNAAREVLFLVAGANKRDVLARIVAGDTALPAARVAPRSGKLAFFVDRAADPGPAAA